MSRESWASSDAVRRSMLGNRRRDTAPELALRSALHQLGLRFRVDVRPVATIPRRADVVLRGDRVAVFLDGCFWHGGPTHFRAPAPNAGHLETNDAVDERGLLGGEDRRQPGSRRGDRGAARGGGLGRRPGLGARARRPRRPARRGDVGCSSFDTRCAAPIAQPVGPVRPRFARAWYPLATPPESSIRPSGRVPGRATLEVGSPRPAALDRYVQGTLGPPAFAVETASQFPSRPEELSRARTASGHLRPIRRQPRTTHTP